MPTQITFRVDAREFDAALRQYLPLTARALPDVLNRKAFFIARGAVHETPKTERSAITSTLGRITRHGSTYTTRLVKGNRIDSAAGLARLEAPLAALIINARLGRKGEHGLYGAKMAAAVHRLIVARMRSIAFLKSGWLPAIHKLDAVIHDRQGAPRAVRGIQQFGAAKGDATPATPGWRPVCRIENTASGPHETHEALVKYGLPALQRAFDNETGSTLAEVARRLHQEAKTVGIKSSFAT